MNRVRSMGTRRLKMSDVLYGDIVRQIELGQFLPAGKLPSEKALGERFGVSRPIVREALERLRADGLIRSRQGAGSFVVGPSAEASRRADDAPAALPPQLHSIADIQQFYEYRIAIEGEIAFAAARNRLPEDIERLGTLLREIKSSKSAEISGIEEDIGYHGAIAEATHNPFFIGMWHASRAHIRFLIELARSLSTLKSPNHAAAVRSSHEPIFHCIRDGDAEGARRWMREHITRSRERVFHGKWL